MRRKERHFPESLTSGGCAERRAKNGRVDQDFPRAFSSLFLFPVNPLHCFETFPLAVLLVESSVRDLHISTSLASLSVSFVLLFLAASDHLSDSLPCPIKLAETSFGRTKLRDPTDLYTATLSNCK